MRVQEAEILRTCELKIQKNHREEEAALKKELDKKHANEQVQFRKDMASQQAKFRQMLLGSSNMLDNEEEYEKKTLEKYNQQKQMERDKRLRNIELQKKLQAQQLDSDLQNKFADYEDMLRRRREKQKEMETEVMGLKNRVDERREKMKAVTKMEGLSPEEKEAMLKDFGVQLEQLDNAYYVEKRRQEILMKQNLEVRRRRHERERNARAAAEKEEQAKLANNMGGGLKSLLLRKKTIRMSAANENTELMRRLRAWKQQRNEIENKKYMEKLSDSRVDLDDASTKIMILKLITTEKMLKDVASDNKKRHKKLASSPTRMNTAQRKVRNTEIQRRGTKRLGDSVAYDNDSEGDRFAHLNRQSTRKSTSRR